MVWIKTTLNFNNLRDEVLYRASRNGLSAENFHNCCDVDGASVTIIKVANFIFGGFTTQTWTPADHLLLFVKSFPQEKGAGRFFFFFFYSCS